MKIWGKKILESGNLALPKNRMARSLLNQFLDKPNGTEYCVALTDKSTRLKYHKTISLQGMADGGRKIEIFDQYTDQPHGLIQNLKAYHFDQHGVLIDEPDAETAIQQIEAVIKLAIPNMTKEDALHYKLAMARDGQRVR